VRVHGAVTGQIKARSVNLASTARVIGDILHQDLAIETGAFLEGHCKRMSEDPAQGKINVVGKDDNISRRLGTKPPTDQAAAPKGGAGEAQGTDKKVVVGGSR